MMLLWIFLFKYFVEIAVTFFLGKIAMVFQGSCTSLYSHDCWGNSSVVEHLPNIYKVLTVKV